jgi:hypothetical protein
MLIEDAVVLVLLLAFIGVITGIRLKARAQRRDAGKSSRSDNAQSGATARGTG